MNYFQSFHAALQEQYHTDICPVCGGVEHIHLSENSQKNDVFKKALNAFKKLFKKGTYLPSDLSSTPEYSDLIRTTAEHISTAIPQETPPILSQYLSRDVFLFSGLRTHAQLTEARTLLRGEDGNIRPYRDFAKKVLTINQAYNRNYLEAEYLFAVQSATSAQNWADFSDDIDRYLLQYRTAADDKVRISHATLNGITLAKNDPFWRSFFPPNGWRCRCRAVEVLSRKNTPSDSADAVKKGEKATTELSPSGTNKLAMFRFNPGIERKVFPPNNSYTKVIGANLAKKEIEKLSAHTCLPIATFPNGGIAQKHYLLDDTTHDYPALVEIATSFAKQGKTATLTPRIHHKSDIYPQLYAPLLGTKYERKCPDLLVDGQFYEYEGFSKQKNALRNMLNKGLKQAPRLIIQDDGQDLRHLRKIIGLRINEKQSIEELWIKKGTQLIQVYP